jgi:SAM-dependent methyltransferase
VWGGWVSILRELGLEWGETTLVIGEDADLLAEAYEAAGAPPVVHRGEGFAVLSDKEQIVDGARPSDMGRPDGSVGLVVLRHAVPNQASLVGALREAYRVLAPGAGILVTDLSLKLLMSGTTTRYLSRLQYLLFPDLLEREARRHMNPAGMDVEVVRAGFRDVDAYDVDEEVEEFAGPEAYVRFVREGGWRSTDLMTDGQLDLLLEELRRRLPELAGGLIIEREPWHVTRGFKPS